MKKVSIVVAVVMLFSATVMMSSSEALTNNCFYAVQRLKPCLPQIETRIPAPINSLCCAAVSEATEECPAYFRSFWISRAYKICNAEDSQPAKALSPPLPPPQSKPHSPPKEDVNQCNMSLLQPCMKKLVDFADSRSPTISGDCCATLTGLLHQCGPTYYWSESAVDCLDYCHNNYPLLPSIA